MARTRVIILRISGEYFSAGVAGGLRAPEKIDAAYLARACFNSD